MDLTGLKLADCLSGKKEAVSISFKDSSSRKLMEDYYCNSPMLSTLAEQLGAFLNAVLSKTDTNPDAPIRNLEIGAGFGSTTTRLA